jgi:hypothetical protein
MMPGMKSNTCSSPVSFYLRTLPAKPGFPIRAWIVSDASTVEAVRGVADRKDAKRYASGADAVWAQARCEAAGVRVSIVAVCE